MKRGSVAKYRNILTLQTHVSSTHLTRVKHFLPPQPEKIQIPATGQLANNFRNYVYLARCIRTLALGRSTPTEPPTKSWSIDVTFCIHGYNRFFDHQNFVWPLGGFMAIVFQGDIIAKNSTNISRWDGKFALLLLLPLLCCYLFGLQKFCVYFPRELYQF